MNEVITVTQQLGFWQYFLLNANIMLRLKPVKFALIIMGALSLVLIITSALSGAEVLPLVFTTIFQLLIVPALYLALAFMATLITRLFFGKYFKPITYTFNHWGVITQGTGIDASTQWRKIIRAKETGKAFHLYVTPAVAIVILKENFTDIRDISALGSLIDEKVNGGS